ncbi:MAG TPA: FAD-dependent oxidoreductase [Geobacteraceae bacterium]
MKKVLILGGGIAGVEAAISLTKKVRNGRQLFDVTVVSDRDYLYVYPISIWVPTGGKSFEDVCIPLAALAAAHGFKVVRETVRTVAAAERQIVTDRGSHRYDYLIIALGAGKLKPKGSEHTLSICGNPSEALRLKERLDTLLAAGGGRIAVGFGGNPLDSSAVRGGPAFEFLFNVEALLRRRGIRERFELTFFAPMASPGARMGEKAVSAMQSFFGRLGVKTAFGRKIAEFVPDGVVLEDGERIHADLTMFIPAGNGHEVLKSSGLPLNEAGFVRIDNHCEVPLPSGEKTAVYAVGDAAALEGPDWRAKQGHIAEVMARCAADNISAAEIGGEKRGYREHVNILCLMDMGNGGALVYRDDRRAVMLPLPVVGHWLKAGWGAYYRLSKLNRIPRLPFM